MIIRLSFILSYDSETGTSFRLPLPSVLLLVPGT